MKKTLIALALMCTALSASATSEESLCLTVGRYAKAVAEMRESGVSEEKAKTIITDERIRRPAEDIISFVYTMGFDPETARRMVYLKCTTSKFGIPDNAKK